MAVKQEIKSQLAKLLATEDIVVEHKQVETAQFDVHTRTLTLPLWEKASDTVYDMLVGHEVGHALFTPDEDWTKDVDVPQQFMNVVEDVRIEKLIKRKYLGLAKTFYKAYNELSQADFFGIEDEDVDSLNLADRVNLYYKIGAFHDVSFTTREKEIVSLIGKTETFEEVKEAARILYEYCIEKHKVESEVTPTEASEDNQHFDMNSPLEDLDADTDDGVDGEEDNSAPEGNTSLNDSSSNNQVEDDSKEDELEVKTEAFSSQKIKDLVNENAIENAYVTVTDLNIENIIATNQEIHEYIDYEWFHQQKKWKDAFSERFGEGNQIPVGLESMYSKDIFAKQDSDYFKFKKDAQKEVSYLVKEFECKKAASAYARATTSRTGVLDTTKLQTYKFNEDLFKKISVIPDGKNHGLIFILDWSGSMNHVLQDTLKQLYNLIWFCRKVSIPFDVYAFTNEWKRSGWDYEKEEGIPTPHKPYYDPKEYEFFVSDDFTLMNIFTSDVNAATLEHQMINIWRIAGSFSYNTRYRYPEKMCLSATPLNESILCLHKILPQFQKKNSLEKVQCIILTDGESHTIPYHKVVHRSWEDDPRLGQRGIGSNAFLRDRKLGKVYDFGHSYTSFTQTLIQNLKDKFPTTNFIGIRIVAPREGRYFMRHYASYEDYDKLDKEWRRNKSFCMKHLKGYDAYFGMSSNALAEDSEFDVDEDATKAQIKKAFVKSLKTKKLNKKVLGEFISLVV